MDYDLKEVEKSIRAGIWSWASDDKFEDAVQEALLHAWNDIESGRVESFHHVVNRARVKARSFLLKPFARATGSPTLSRDGMSTHQADLMRSKVSAYRQEFFNLHDRLPSSSEISQGTGIHRESVANYVRQIKNGDWDHAQYEVEGNRRRIAISYFKPHHITVENQDTIGGLNAVEFETELISNLDFERFLSRIEDDVDREVLYLWAVKNYSGPEIAKHFGDARYQQGTRRIKHALETAKYLLTGETASPQRLLLTRKDGQTVDRRKMLKTHCKNGHKRTPENTNVWTVNGKQKRCCRQCRLDREKEKRARKKLEGK